VLNHFLVPYKELIPNNEPIEQIKLYDDIVPMIDKTDLSAWEKQGNGQKLTDEEKKVTERMSEILKQLKSANTYHIV
ncbi:FMN-dependent NADH-azoreductase, partial [Bacillus cereus group sp. N24]|nr:FMN-dependent NADH-azoreductase [Bacillus cereus group sp. N24]